MMRLLFLSVPVACVVAALIDVSPTPAALATTQMPAVSLAWSMPIEEPTSIAFSPCGRFFCVVTDDGTLTCYTSQGDKVYSAQIPGNDTAVLAPDGRFAMAYSHRTPIGNRLTFIDSDGQRLWEVDVTGAIWSADVCSIEDGARFIVGTGERYLYVVDVTAKRKKYRRWRTPGAVVSVNIDPRGEQVTYGTWQRSALGRATVKGKTIWRTDADQASLQYVRLLDSPDRLFVRSLPNRSGADGVFAVLDASGGRIWEGKIECDSRTKVLPSPSGNYVCLGYDKRIKHKGKSVCEKHATLYDARGKRLWDKGSLFFQADPILVTSDGCVLVRGTDNVLYSLNPTGNIKPSVKLPASINRSTVSADASRVLLHCADGKLYMLDLSP